MVHVRRRMVRRITTLLSNWTRSIDEINQGLTRAELSKAKLSWAALQLAT